MGEETDRLRENLKDTLTREGERGKEKREGRFTRENNEIQGQKEYVAGLERSYAGREKVE